MNVYTQVLDGAARSAADRVGSELFRIVQKSGEPSESTELPRKKWLLRLDRTSNPPVNSVMPVVGLAGSSCR
jgi:hypothetical protein